VAGFGEAERLTVTFERFTTSVIGVEVLWLLELSPLYVAVRKWLPTARVDIVNVALPLLSGAVPIAIPLSLNVTDPVALMGITITFSVTRWPEPAGLGKTERLVVV
jgi:hypothetical protein